MITIVLNFKSEEEERRQQWNLNVINPAPAEMALEAKPPMFDDKDIGVGKLE